MDVEGPSRDALSAAVRAYTTNRRCINHAIAAHNDSEECPARSTHKDKTISHLELLSKLPCTVGNKESRGD
jgi:hypothetical protein